MVLVATGAGDVERCSLAGKAGGGQGCLVEEAALELGHKGLQSWPLGAQGSLGIRRNKAVEGGWPQSMGLVKRGKRSQNLRNTCLEEHLVFGLCPQLDPRE